MTISTVVAPRRTTPHVVTEDKFFHAVAEGDMVTLTISPIVDKVRGGLRGFTEEHLIGKCCRLVSMTNHVLGGYYWGQVYTFTFRVFPECPEGTFHACEVSRDRLETILNLALRTDC